MINKIVINGYEFSTSSDMILNNTYLTGSMLESTTYKKPFSNGQGRNKSSIGKNGILVKGTIIKGSNYELNNEIDLFYRSIFTDEELDLEVYVQTGINTEEKRVGKCIIATQNPLNQESWMINIADFEFIMDIDMGTIEDESYTQSSSEFQIGSKTYSGIIIDGQFKTYPYFDFEFLEDDITFLEIVIGSNIIKVEQNIQNGDILIVDCENKIIRLNDVLQDYSGIFPYFNTGNNTFELNTDDSKIFRFSYKYKKQFIK